MVLLTYSITFFSFRQQENMTKFRGKYHEVSWERGEALQDCDGGLRGNAVKLRGECGEASRHRERKRSESFPDAIGRSRVEEGKLRLFFRQLRDIAEAGFGVMEDAAALAFCVKQTHQAGVIGAVEFIGVSVEPAVLLG